VKKCFVKALMFLIPAVILAGEVWSVNIITEQDFTGDGTLDLKADNGVIHVIDHVVLPK
jgi:hypothetical protein